jgi:hypothetical protein
VYYGLTAKFLRQFPPSLAEGSRAAWCDGASGDEWGNYFQGVGYNKLNSFSVEDPAQRPLTFKLYSKKNDFFFVAIDVIEILETVFLLVIPVEGEIFPHPSIPAVGRNQHPLQWVKWPMRGIVHPSHLPPRLKKE